jgi:hypothetical protein
MKRRLNPNVAIAYYRMGVALLKGFYPHSNDFGKETVKKW